jgi:hypothetical protein
VFAAGLLLALLLLASGAGAQAVVAPVSQFDLTGFLQEATVDTAADVLSGGTLKLNGHVITVPRNTVVILPAAALTWQQLFELAPAPYGPTQTGMALADLPAPLSTYEVRVIGNRVVSGAADSYIAGLVSISQQTLSTGQGYINFIDYANGEMRVGGAVGSSTTGARVRINDPVLPSLGTGRYSKGLSPDVRFTSDQDNPTIRTETGFPMCLPRVAPTPAQADLRCPERNRPKDALGVFQTIFTFPPPAGVVPGGADPRLQMPFEVGDYVSFAGTLVTDNLATPTVGPYPGTAATYISAHTIVANLGVYTAPGSDPAYLAVDVTLLGVGGITIAGVAEATVRTRFEGFSTDPTRNVHLFGIDVDCATGATTDRDWGSVTVDQGAAAGGAVKGRWRFIPPSKVLTINPNGFLPPTREVRAAIFSGEAPGNFAAPFTLATQPTFANGLITGQYRAPITEYLFPEQVVGNPIPPDNFETFPFLAQGGLTVGGAVTGQLAPWPGNPVPLQCAGAIAPIADAGPAQTVASLANVTLNGGASTGTSLLYTWDQILTGTEPVVNLVVGANPAIATFTAPAVTAITTLTFQLTASNAVGTSSSTTTVTINPAAAPTASAGAAQTIQETVASPSPLVTLNGSATSNPGALPLTYHWSQTSGPLVVLSTNNSPAASHPTFSAPILAVGAAPAVLSFTLVITSSANVSSAPSFTTVTLLPPPDVVTITGVEYRTGKQRLTIDATSSVVSPTISLILQTFNVAGGTRPGATLTNLGGGAYQLVLVGVPQPSGTVTVTSTAGGSATSPITRLRQ